MNDLSVSYRRVIEELVTQRVPLAYLESINGAFVSIVTASGVPVLTLSRTMATKAGIVPDSEFFSSQSKCTPRAASMSDTKQPVRPVDTRSNAATGNR